jgi:hypothetical protein
MLSEGRLRIVIPKSISGRPAQVMSEAECEEGIDILTTWWRDGQTKP